MCIYVCDICKGKKSRKPAIEVIYLSCHNFILGINHGDSEGETGTAQAFVTKIQRCAASYPIVSGYSIILSWLRSDAYYLRVTYPILPRRIRFLRWRNGNVWRLNILEAHSHTSTQGRHGIWNQMLVPRVILVAREPKIDGSNSKWCKRWRDDSMKKASMKNLRQILVK